MHVVIVYLLEESKKHGVPGVVGPFDTIDEAAEFGNWLRNIGADEVKIAQMSKPLPQWKETKCKSQ